MNYEEFQADKFGGQETGAFRKSVRTAGAVVSASDSLKDKSTKGGFCDM